MIVPPDAKISMQGQKKNYEKKIRKHNSYKGTKELSSSRVQRRGNPRNAEMALKIMILRKVNELQDNSDRQFLKTRKTIHGMNEKLNREAS